MIAKQLVMQCPFWDAQFERMVCRVKVSRDIILLWQPNCPEVVGGLILPETVRDWYKPQIGVIVSAGPGYYNKKGFVPNGIKPEMVVVWDKNIPWKMDVTDSKGVTHELKYMGERDVRLLVDPDQEIDEIGTLINAGRRLNNMASI